MRAARMATGWGTAWLTAIVLLVGANPGQAQVGTFQIVWVVIGEVATSQGDRPIQAGKHLFMATDLTNLALKQITIAQVDAEPTVTALQVGERFCLTSLRISASAADRSFVKRAPLSVSVRQDHRDALQLQRTDQDICIQPTAAGEYPIRFTSLLPANDGSTRGAQIFIRVAEQSPVSH